MAGESSAPVGRPGSFIPPLAMALERNPTVLLLFPHCTPRFGRRGILGERPECGMSLGSDLWFLHLVRRCGLRTASSRSFQHLTSLVENAAQRRQLVRARFPQCEHDHALASSGPEAGAKGLFEFADR